MPGQSQILVVDDEKKDNELYCQTLRSAGYKVEGVFNVERALTMLKQRHFDLVVLDLLIPLPPWPIQEKITGLYLLKQIKEYNRKIEVIVVTKVPEAGMEMEALRIGALDFFTKPVDPQRLLSKVMSVIPAVLRMSLKTEPWYVYDSPEMAQAFEIARIWAASNRPILIIGEPGTGKETLAEIIHVNTRKAAGAELVSIDCVQLTVDLERLVGNAAHPQSGGCAQAGRGTIILKNIHRLPYDMQLQIEALIGNGRYFPVGAGEPVVCDARIIATATETIRSLVQSGDFWDVLYQSFGVVIDLPPLRQRRSDIKKIAVRLIEHYKMESKISRDVLALLEAYDYEEANINELKIILRDASERAAGGMIEVKHLPLYLRPAKPKPDRSKEQSKDCTDLLRLLGTHQRRLHLLELRSAATGMQTDPAVLIEIEQCKEEIARCEKKWSDLGCT